MTKTQITRGLAGAAAVAALAVAGAAVSSGSNSPSQSAAAQRPAGAGTFNGTPPTGGRPNFGSPVTGAAADRAKAAALAKYPGQVERVMKAPSGTGYEVHVIKSDGSEVHVLVSADFQVTGTETGRPGRGQMPNGGTPPSPPKAADGSTASTDMSQLR